MTGPLTSLWAPKAWVHGPEGGAWQERVSLVVSADGRWQSVTPNTDAAADALVLRSALLPGMVNAHSHAFQRAFAGKAESRQGDADDFWSWRQQMYGLALCITPDQMYAIARQLYIEMRRGGYTQVCEFHYLHHQPHGTPYPGLIDMSLALVQAAVDVGIGMTLLPVLYERAGFQQTALRDDQCRFATDVATVLRLRDEVRSHAQRQGWRHVTVGTAVHSLRAARAESIAELWRAVKNDPAPLHIHIAEQTGEVDDCLAATGQRPLEWLCNGLGQGVEMDARWQLVHATHATRSEIAAVARSGAAMVLCPSTEANLGDGLTDLPHWLQCNVPMAIGSDSHVTRDWREELRLAEYGQRLMHRQRNVLADPQRYGGSTASRLFDCAVQAGAGAAGLGVTGIRVGARADGLVMDDATQSLDEAVFSSPAQPYAHVWVAGQTGPGQGYT